MRWQFALLYLGNIVIFSKSSQKHIGHIQTVLSHPRNACITLKLKKCRYFTESIDHLVHEICSRRVKIASNTKDAINALEASTNIMKLRSFLGLRNVSRRFSSSFARLAASLNTKLRKDQPETFRPFNKGELTYMLSLMNALISAHILTLPKSTGHVTLDTNACDIQIGYKLLQ